MDAGAWLLGIGIGGTWGFLAGLMFRGWRQRVWDDRDRRDAKARVELGKLIDRELARALPPDNVTAQLLQPKV